jgi:2-oxoglutarate dehydrogenase E1 component
MLSGTSLPYVEQMHEQYLKAPTSVHASWQAFFANVDKGLPPGLAYTPPPSYTAGIAPTTTTTTTAHAASAAAPALSGGADAAASMSMRAMQLIRTFQVRGHLLAKTDPLGLVPPIDVPELTKEFYGFSDADLDTPIFVGLHYVKGFLADERPYKTLREILALCTATYCGPIGAEYMHIDDRSRCDWLRQRLELLAPPTPSPSERLRNWDRLAWAVTWEKFLHKKYQDKRFGIDGGESTVLALKAIIDRCGVAHGVEDINIGMAHRGRLNVLANVMRKPMRQIFKEFEGKLLFSKDDWSSSGDVKYHLGYSCDRKLDNGKTVHLSLLANPSHLEAVNPIVEGKTFAKQYFKKDADKRKCMSLLVHGDASFAGQGVVYETLELSTVRQYSTGGTIHVVVNNQIGFTTQLDVRAGKYCTDVAKSIDAPIFHVNGDDPEAVVRCAQLAADFRREFGQDVVIDLICYRRYGHNEIDQPKFTQPKMYTRIEKMPTVLDLYTEKLIAAGVATKAELEAQLDAIHARVNAESDAAKDFTPPKGESLDAKWANFVPPTVYADAQDTGVGAAALRELGAALTQLPPAFAPHSTVARLLKDRAKMLETGADFDWATGEALAFASLAAEGTHVRLSGQDVERGTFSHRHAVLHDQKSFETYMPLAHVKPGRQAGVTITNSNLSEFACLGFETGFSLEDPNALVCWEAQFGDFVNTAQVILDQFIASGEQKWRRQCGITLLLPHGNEGQGPEHSSARLERFLLGSDSDPSKATVDGCSVQQHNWQVCNITTPANYFHALRRQIHRRFRKPLIIMTPKSLLRHPLAKSPLADFESPNMFKRLIPEAFPAEIGAPADVKQIIFCSGKVYYDLLERRRKLEHKDTAIVRLEQLVPFPFPQVTEQGKLYPNARITWCQEESMNMGAYYFVYHHLLTALGQKRAPRYVGRPPAAAPATGSSKNHAVELERFLEHAFDIKK